MLTAGKTHFLSHNPFFTKKPTAQVMVFYAIHAVSGVA